MSIWLQFLVGGSWGVLFLMLISRFKRSNWAKVRLEALPEAVRRRSAEDPILWTYEERKWGSIEKSGHGGAL